jgi:hypothetical protein
VRALSILLGLILVSTTGCSLLFVKGERKQSTVQAPIASTSGERKCTTSRALPILDTVVAVSAGVLGLAVMSGSGGCYTEDSNGNKKPIDRTLCGGVSLLTGAGFGLSATYGYAATNRCKNSNHNEWEEIVVTPAVRPETAQQRNVVAKDERDQFAEDRQGGSTPKGIVRSEPPSGTNGFVLGATAAEVMENCSKVGGTWQLERSKLRCDLPSRIDDVELLAQVVFTHERATSIRLVRVAQDQSVSVIKTTFERVVEQLKGKYGQSDQFRVSIPSTCQATLASCLRDHRASASYSWNWPSRLVVRSALAATPNAVLFELEYRDLRPADANDRSVTNPLDASRAVVDPSVEESATMTGEISPPEPP